MSKTNKYQLAENKLQLQNATKLYTNATITNFTRPVLNVFDKSKGCIAAPNHTRCTVPKNANPEGYRVCATGRCQCLGYCENVFNSQIVINLFPCK